VFSTNSPFSSTRFRGNFSLRYGIFFPSLAEVLFPSRQDRRHLVGATPPPPFGAGFSFPSGADVSEFLFFQFLTESLLWEKDLPPLSPPLLSRSGMRRVANRKSARGKTLPFSLRLRVARLFFFFASNRVRVVSLPDKRRLQLIRASSFPVRFIFLPPFYRFPAARSVQTRGGFLSEARLFLFSRDIIESFSSPVAVLCNGPARGGASWKLRSCPRRRTLFFAVRVLGNLPCPSRE